MSDPYIKEAASLMDQAKGALSSGATQIKGMAENVDLQKLMPYLLAGGAGAVGGAALSGKRKERSGETRGQYLTRILRNAVATGALAGVGSYAAAEGFKKTVGKVDLENPVTGKEGDQGPLAEGARGALFGAPAAVISGAGVLGATNGMKSIGGVGDVDDAKKLLMGGLANARDAKAPTGLNPVEMDAWNQRDALLQSNPDIDRVRNMSTQNPEDFRRLLGGDASLIHEARRLGLNTHDPEVISKFMGTKLKGVAHKLHTAGKYPSLVIGRTGARRAGRGILGGIASLIPAVLGSVLTDRPE